MDGDGFSQYENYKMNTHCSAFLIKAVYCLLYNYACADILSSYIFMLTLLVPFEEQEKSTFCL